MYEKLTIAFILIFTILLIIEKILDMLNASWYSKPYPIELETLFEDVKFKSLEYKKAKFRFSLINNIFIFFVTFSFWIFGGFGWLSNTVNLISQNIIVLNLVFFGIISFFSFLLSTPFSLYYIFVLEEKFGFNKMTVKTYIMDLIKSSLLGLLIGGGIITFIVFIYNLSPSNFWWIVWIAISLFMLFTITFYSNLIVPLFNKQEPLEEGELKNAIEKLAKKLGFKIKNIFTIDGSKRSTKANAYFTGLGSKKRIVLYDTLINDLETEEILAVLAHEIGHYKRKHTQWNSIFSVLQTGVMLYIFSLFIHPDSSIALLLNKVVARDPGLIETHFYLGVIGFGLLYSPISTILSIVINTLSRKYEYQADDFAKKAALADQLKSALIKLSKNSLSNLRPHPAYVFVNYSHPPLFKKIRSFGKTKVKD
jgi:STE24 endopeptidase